MKPKLLLFLITLCFLQFGYSQSGSLDATFGNGGIVTADLGENYSALAVVSGTKALYSPDGSLFQIKNPFLVIKRHPDGSIDSSYGLNGFSRGIQLREPQAILQSDGKMIVAGTVGDTGTLLRLKTNGFIDSSFGLNGFLNITFRPTGIALQQDGKILLTGEAQGFLVARFNIDGSVDNSFNNGIGLVITPFYYSLYSDRGDYFGEVPNGNATAVVVQNDGKIVVGGSANLQEEYAQFAVIRYNTDGSIDSSFDNDGRHTTRLNNAFDERDVGEALAIQNDGKIILAGRANNNFAVARYNTDGSLDNTFNGTGTLVTTIQNYAGADITLQSNGKIILGGSTINDFVVLRLNIDGSFDNSFSGDGVQTTDIHSSDDEASSLILQSDGKIVLTGTEFFITNARNFQLIASVRYNTDGSLDNSFDHDGKLEGVGKLGNTSFISSTLQTDGKLVVSGTTWNGKNYDIVVARYNSDGSPDNTFSSDGVLVLDMGSQEYASNVIIQKDGKILLSGTRGFDNSQVVIMRFNSNGTADNTIFQYQFGAAADMALQSDGKILLSFHTSERKYKIVRYNVNGQVDNTFGTNGISEVQTASIFIGEKITVQADDKILIAGTVFDTYARMAIARLGKDGTLDNTFDGDGLAITDFGNISLVTNAITLQKDGKIIAGGGGQGSELNLSLARYNPDGSTDNTFGSGGKQTFKLGNVTSLDVQDDNKIVASILNPYDQKLTLARFNTNGNFDSSFGNNGLQITVAGTGGGRFDDIIFDHNKLYAVGSAEFPGTVGLAVRYLLDNAGQTPPVVSLTVPANDATFISPVKSLYLKAIASSSVGIAKVEFYNGTTLLNMQLEAPYGYTWKNITTGNYVITAKATDLNGVIATSTPVTIHVNRNQPPVVAFIKPLQNKIFPRTSVINIEANAFDDGRVTRVEFYNGNTLLHKEYEAPYTYAWENVPVGKYILTAKAFDNYGASSTTSINISVQINKAPSVEITSPAVGTSYTAPASINLSANASDEDGRITRVEFYDGSNLIHTEFELPYTYHWQNVPAGTHTIVALAKDDFGAKSTSKSVEVKVGSGPAITLNHPSHNVTNDSLNKLIVLLSPSAFISPNPAKNIINVSAKGFTKDGTMALLIFSSNGTMVKQMKMNTKMQTISVDISTLQSGTYTLQLKSGDNIITKQFIKL